MKKLLLIVVGVLIGILISKSIFNLISSNRQTSEEAQIITEKIEAVSKLVLAEGMFSEIYSYSDAKVMFYDLISFEKKALLVVKAKAMVSYDLGKMEIDLDKENKKLIIKSLPGTDLDISQDIHYYDLQQSTFNNFSRDDLNKLNKRSRELMEEKIRESELPGYASNRLAEVIENITFLAESLGWSVENEAYIENGG